MQNLASLLGKKYKYELRYFRATEIIQKNWESIVKGLTNVLVPKNIYRNELVIECNNPIWLSEIDCFKEEILNKVNHLLKSNRLNLKIVGIKPMFNSELTISVKKEPAVIPNDIEHRIQWNIENKQKNGRKLCNQCQKVWDKNETCRLCQLTGS